MSRLLIMALLFLLLIAVATNHASPIKQDETVLFFPTCARLVDDGATWELPIHGWIYEPETDGLFRSALLGTLRRAMQLDREQAETQIFKDRARSFLVDNERNKQITIEVGNQRVALNPSGANGHFEGTLRLAAAEVPRLVKEERQRRYIPFQAVTSEDDSRDFLGRVELLAPTGLSVISDIDDTIKISQVLDRKELIQNTFLRPFRPVPGMSLLYQGWAAGGASFHYVTSSPWQLYEHLARFLRDEGYPLGTLHMKLFRLKDSTAGDLFADPEMTKPKAIVPLLQAYPGRRFILVGDSGERDPEVYGTVARKFPQQIERILIRRVEGADNSPERFREAFREIPAERWLVFADPAEIK